MRWCVSILNYIVILGWFESRLCLPSKLANCTSRQSLEDNVEVFGVLESAESCDPFR